MNGGAATNADCVAKKKAWEAVGSALRIPGYAMLVAFDKPSHARLSAAAPDMLAALRQIADISEGSGTVNSLPHLAKIARAAIAKAEGRDDRRP